MTAVERVLAGTTMTLVAAFRNRAGQPANPEQVAWDIRPPGLSPVTKVWTSDDPADVRNPTAGSFEVDVSTANAVGRWTWRATASGDADCPVEGYFDVVHGILRGQ